MKSPATAINPHDEQHYNKPLWAVYGPSIYWPSVLCCRLKESNGTLNIWGYSVWKRSPGFRTMGIPVDTFIEREGFCFFFADQHHALDYMKEITTPKTGI